MAIATAAEPKPKKILIINDTQEILDLFWDIFEEEGDEIFLYSYPLNDLIGIERMTSGLIVLDDVSGGKVDGWQTLQ